MTERIDVGDLVLLSGEALKARFPMGLDVDSTTPLRVVSSDKTTGMVVVGLLIFEQPFHKDQLLTAPPVLPPHGGAPEPEPEPPPPDTQAGGLGATIRPGPGPNMRPNPNVGPVRPPVRPPPTRPR